jgi:meiotic recombination protein SPO11
MDIGLSPILVNCQPVLNGDLLSNLPDRPLTQDIRRFNHNALGSGAGGREISTTYVNAGNPNQAGYVISKIEDIFESIADSILNQKQELVIHLRTRRKPGPQNSPAQVRPVKTYEVRFPSKSSQEAWKFSEYMTSQS